MMKPIHCEHISSVASLDYNNCELLIWNDIMPAGSNHTANSPALAVFLVVQFMGIVVGSAVPPIAFCITWNKISAAGAISGALSGGMLS